MLASLSNLEKGFLKIAEKSRKECGNELEAMRQLIFIIHDFDNSVIEHCILDEKSMSPKYLNSLVYWCYEELFRTSGHILFLSIDALYRNAFDDVRHALESIVQALYIDYRHPRASLEAKIEILKEVEDKREYHALRLIDELKIDDKEKLKREYKQLSSIIHPSHKQIVATFTDIAEEKGIPATVDCEEISKIYSSMEKMFDIFLFLFITYFPEIKESLKKNPDINKHIKAHNMVLLDFSLRARKPK